MILKHLKPDTNLATIGSRRVGAVQGHPYVVAGQRLWPSARVVLLSGASHE